MSEVSLKKRWVLLSGLLLLKGHLWRWLVLFVPMCAGMFVAQRSLFPGSGDGWKKSALDLARQAGREFVLASEGTIRLF